MTVIIDHWVVAYASKAMIVLPRSLAVASSPNVALTLNRAHSMPEMAQHQQGASGTNEKAWFIRFIETWLWECIHFIEAVVELFVCCLLPDYEGTNVDVIHCENSYRFKTCPRIRISFAKMTICLWAVLSFTKQQVMPISDMSFTVQDILFGYYRICQRRAY